jgi:hypothetical protein
MIALSAGLQVTSVASFVQCFSGSVFQWCSSMRREDEARYGDAAQPDQAIGVGTTEALRG